MEKVERCFCKNCKKETGIVWGTTSRTTYIKEIPFDFSETIAICKECGHEVVPKGLIAFNMKEFGDQYYTLLENEAKLCNDEIEDHTDCQECGEDYLFKMKDNFHEFSIGLKTALVWEMPMSGSGRRRHYGVKYNTYTSGGWSGHRGCGEAVQRQFRAL